MMLLPLLRPVSKGASRILLAGTSASSLELKDLPNEAPQTSFGTPIAPHALVLGEDAYESASYQDNSFVRKNSSGNRAENAYVRKNSSNSSVVTQVPEQLVQYAAGNTSLWQYGANSYHNQPHPEPSSAAANHAEQECEGGRATESDGVAQTSASSSSSYPAGLTVGGPVLWPVLWPVHGFAFGQPAWSMGMFDNVAHQAAAPPATSSSAVPVAADGAEVGATSSNQEDANNVGFATSQADAAQSGDIRQAAPEVQQQWLLQQCRTGASRRQRRRRRNLSSIGLLNAGPVNTSTSGAALPAEVAFMRRAVEDVRRARGEFASPAGKQGVQQSRPQAHSKGGASASALPQKADSLPKAAAAASLEEFWSKVPLSEAWADIPVESPFRGMSPSPLPDGDNNASKSGNTSTRCESPVQFWPATPESTPPQTPRMSYTETGSTTCLGSVVDVIGSDITTQSDSSLDLVVSQLEQGSDAAERRQILDWVVKFTWPLASSPAGCRVVQKAIEVANAPDQLKIAEQLRGHIKEAAASPHANHVVQKCIVSLPPEQIRFMLTELQGNAVVYARHRYGCRVLERLIEHCPKEYTQPLLEEVLEGTEKLCRHAFGNFVVQHVLEHGSPKQRSKVTDVLLSDTVRLAKHRVASHVVKSALTNCEWQDKERLMQALSANSMELADLAHHHCGSFVVRELRRATAARPAA